MAPAANITLRRNGRRTESGGCAACGKPVQGATQTSGAWPRLIIVRPARCLECQKRVRAAFRASPYSAPGLEEAIRRLLQRAKAGAKTRGKLFALCEADLLDLWMKQGGKCALTGMPLLFGADQPTLHAPSIDRIDSSGGYTADNVWLVCWAVNLMKSDMPTETFGEWCKRVVLHSLRES